MKKPDNLLFVIFGATGDLAARMLVPAIYSLKEQNLLPQVFAVIGIGRTELTTEEFRKNMAESIRNHSELKESDPAAVTRFTECFEYHRMEYSDPAGYKELEKSLEKLAVNLKIGRNIIFYMATPPSVYETISDNLAGAGFVPQDEGFRRFIYEKPFGYDLKSAVRLNKLLHGLMPEDQIYRIDHYLGKETVQNLLVLRFSNGIFEPLWNRNYVHRVEITSAENIGVEMRGRYYDSSGALRDMFQNHLLQLVGLTAMEPPSSLGADAIRNEVLKVLQSFQPLREEDVERQVIRGQYTGSRVRGECITGYRYEKDVDVRSKTETYVAAKFYVDNWRWGGVPFYVRTGKRMPTKVTEIVIHFRQTPHHLFIREVGQITGNHLIIRIQPDEGIVLKFDMKNPGAGFNVKNVGMEFHYKDLAEKRIPSAYERLLHDVMIGDSTLFLRDDEIETAWKFIDPILNAWQHNPAIKIYGYPAGTWGPDVSNNLFESEGVTWRYPSRNLADEELYCEL